MFKNLPGQKREAKRGGLPRPGPVVATTYVSHPVDIPDDFLAPLPDPSVIKVEKVDFEKTPLPEYKDYYAVVIDNLLSKEECDDLIRLTEMSAGAHQEGIDVSNNGWKPAMVNAGVGYEFLALDYRNSDRIIWDQKVIAERLWARVQQAQGMKEYFAVLEGETYNAVRAPFNERVDGQRWEIVPQGINERLRFLKYGAGQFFKEHCDGAYGNADGTTRSYYTIHLYLNDSAQALGIPPPKKDKKNGNSDVDPRDELLRGGATTFYSTNRERKLDVDPKVGRVLIFQHKRLLHAGDEVISGIKYTMRSDLMYELKEVKDSAVED